MHVSAAVPNVTIFCLAQPPGKDLVMPEVSAPTAPAPQPLVNLTEDENLFRENVRQFAEDSLRPKVREMDEKGVFERGLIDQFFQLGLKGIEIPQQYGG